MLKIKKLLMVSVLGLGVSLLTSCAYCPLYASDSYALAERCYCNHEYNRAFTEFLKSANRGNPAAQYRVGYMYFYGIGIERDQDQGRDWIRRSARQNYPCAIKALNEIVKVRAVQSRR